MATHSEIKDIIINSIGWKDELQNPITLDAANQVTDSGRYFQDEHTAVTIENIKDCQRIANISDDDMNTVLAQMRESVVYKVISDVFNRSDIQENVIRANPRIFDNAISLRMVLDVSELITTSTRSNSIQRFTKDFIGKLHFDIFGNSQTKFAVTNRNYKWSMGLSSRYGAEIWELRRFFGTNKALKSITKGEAFNPYIPEYEPYIN